MSNYEELANKLEQEMEERRVKNGYTKSDIDSFDDCNDTAGEVVEEKVISDDEPVIENTNECAIVPTNVPSEVANFTDIATERMQKDFVAGKRDVNETGKDIVHALTLGRAVEETYENKDFLKDIKQKKQEELDLSFQNAILREEAQKLDAKRKKNEAFYKAFRPILEFDFSNLRKIQKKRIIKDNEKVDDSRYPRKNKVNAIEYVYEREAPKTYDDRSYGIPLMVLMLCILTLPYCLVTIILSVFNAVNEVFMQIANFGKPALIICSSLAIMFIIGLIVYVILLLIQSSFGVVIFPDIM